MGKIIVLVCISLMIAISLPAQFPAAGVGKGQQAPSIGHIYGKITDSSGASIGDASVLLLQTRFDTVTKKRKEVFSRASCSTSCAALS